MEGLEITELPLSAVLTRNDVFRVDAEYFGKEPLRALKRLQTIDSVPLGDIAFVTDGIHTSLPFRDDGEVKILSAKHPKENYIDRSGFETVSRKFHEANPRTALQVDDVLISTVGTIGNSAVITPDLLPANSDRHVGIIRLSKDAMSPYYLATFLLGKYGRVQSAREVTGNVQPNLFISKLNKLLVPRFSARFEARMARAVTHAYEQLALASQSLTHSAETLVRLAGFDGWQPPETNSYTRDFQEVFASGRMDAENFNPGVQSMLSLLSSSGAVRLGDMCEISSGFAWKSDKFIEDGKGDGEPFVRIRDCKPGGIFAQDLDQLEREYANRARQVKAGPGDIVIGMDGLKWFYAATLNDPSYVNQRVAWLRVEDKTYPSEYITSVINSTIGQGQLLAQMTIAQTVGHITLEDLRNLRIPQLTKRSRFIVADAANDAVRLKRLSLEGLEASKRAVEIAIEDSEAAALAYLDGVAYPAR